MAILVGDVSAVWADGLLSASGFPPDVLVPALGVYHECGSGWRSGSTWTWPARRATRQVARRAASLKGGSYTVEGPLLIGAALAGGSPAVTECLLPGSARRSAKPSSSATTWRTARLRAGVTRETVNGLVAEAKASLDPAVLPAESVTALSDLADKVAM